MTMKHWMLLGICVAGGFLSNPLQGQQPTPAPADPPAPPLIPATEPAPAPKAQEKSEKKATTTPKSTKQPAPAKATGARKAGAPAASASSRDLKPGAAVALSKNVNVRAQAAINSEIVTHVKQGDIVTVLETVTKKAGPDEPDRWAKISLPTGATVWTHASFIDPATKAVKPARLNVRSGPGENFSVLGRIEKGTVVHELERKGDWIKIEAPTNSYAFVAAHLFTQDSGQLAAALARTAPAPTVTAVTPPPANTIVAPPKPVETVSVETRPVIVQPAETTPPPPTTPPPTATPPPTGTGNPPSTTPEPPPPSTTPATTPQLSEAEPLIKRIVTREGIVRGSASIQAPTYFVLRSLDNNKTINYLHSIDTNIVLRSFQHQRVIVVGEEILDERWPNTPVIDVDSIQTVP